MAKTELTASELKVLTDASFMPIKLAVSNKINTLFAELKSGIQGAFQMEPVLLEKGQQIGPGKISRGENYHSFAYRVMDFPSILEKEDIFLFRCLVLWGHHFSFHLILAGSYKSQFTQSLKAGFGDLQQGDWQLSTENGPWEWFLEEAPCPFVRNLTQENFMQEIEKRDFIKLSCRLPLKAFASVPQVGLDHWLSLQKILTR